ncbi:MAG TPA: type II secretion system protein GspG [bacterium]|nr:type II secretion system protein GspG [bacterium]HQO34840.1 type II secretion system protein GspG [bacterium]HQP99342.1 type II secretion system protein GspG [bacterium]
MTTKPSVRIPGIHRSTRNPLRFRLIVSFCIVLFPTPAIGDILIFDDGRRFYCRVLETPEERADQGYRVMSQGNVLWIDKNYVKSCVRDNRDPEADLAEAQALLQTLIQEGRIVPEVGPSLQFIPKPAAPVGDATLAATDIRGWAYLTKFSEIAGEAKSRIAVGDTIPPGYRMEVSPNSRLTLTLGPAAKLGLAATARLDIQSVAFEPETFLYRLDVKLLNGTAWVDVLSLGDLRKVKLIVNGVQIFLNKRLVALRVPQGGGVEIIPLSDSIALTDAKGLRTPKVGLGERWLGAQGVGTGEVVPCEDWRALVAVWDDWMKWQPETLDMEWNPVLPSPQPKPVLSSVLPAFPWRVPVDSSLIVPPENRSMAEMIAAYLVAIRKYREDTGAYPPPKDWMDALFKNPGINGWEGPYVAGDLPQVDLWGNPFVYEIFRDNGTVFVDVRSRGPNGEDERGLGDDIRFGYKE